MRSPPALARRLCVAGWLGLLGLMAGAAQAGDSAYGKTLEKRFELPLAEIARFERFNPQATRAGVQAKQSTGLLVDSIDWTSDEIAVTQNRNPWRIVIKAHGVARDDGPAELRWQPGWKREGVTVGAPTASSGRTAKAGEGFELVTAGAPVSFKEDQKVAVSVGFVKAGNLRLDRVQVEVWSGIGQASMIEKLLSWQAALVGAVMLALALWWRAR